MNTPSDTKQKIWVFFLYGFLGGGVIPIASISILDMAKCFNFIPLNYEIIFYASAFLSIILVSILIIISYDCYEKNEKLAKALCYIAAIISICALHVFVLSTGGSMQSIFTFHYLYVPAVVAITFTGRRGLILAAFACLISFYLNLFCVKIGPISFPYFISTEEWKEIILKSLEYRIVFFAVFLFQLGLAVTTDIVIERKYP